MVSFTHKPYTMKKVYLSVLLTLCVVDLSLAQITQLTTGFTLQGGISDNNKFFFANNDGSAWSSDGTVAGTVSLAQFYSNPKATFFNNKLFFNGWSPTNGIEIWSSDGTVAGSMLVKDINPGSGNSNPGGTDDGDGNFKVVGNTLFFTATTPNEGTELWKTDGTTAGTMLVKDIVPGSASSNIIFGKNSGNTSIGNMLFFIANDGVNGQELWKSDGTTAGTVMVKDITGGSSSTLFGKEFAAFGSTLFFLCNNGSNGAEMWKTDGTNAGTVMLNDISPGGASSFNLDYRFNYLIFNNQFYFVTGTNNSDLWVTDGTSGGTHLIYSFGNANLKDAGNGCAVILNNKFYFSASSSTAPTGNELWMSDGTTGGTQLVKDIYSGPNASDPMIILPRKPGVSGDFYDQFLLPGYKFLFFANDGVHGNELWVSDGTAAGTVLLKDVNPGAGSSYLPDDSTYSGYFFTGNAAFLDLNNGTQGYELWTTDGTSEGTVMVADISAGSPGSNPNFVGMYNRNTVLFQARVGSNLELFKINATVSAFPVKLIDFTAKLNANKVDVDWITAEELNTDRFNVQRSVNGKYFETIGVVKAAGNSSAQQLYTYTDNNLDQRIGRYFYRLEMVDKDASKNYSQIRTVTLNTKVPSVAIVPNPVRNKAEVQLANITGNIVLQVSNLCGQIVLKQNRYVLPGELMEITVSDLPAGVYVLSVDNNGNILTQQFIKQ